MNNPIKQKSGKFMLSEKITFFIFLVLAMFSIIVVLASDLKYGLKNIGYALSYIFVNLFYASVLRLVFVIISIIAIGVFVLFWIIKAKKNKSYSFGPLYFVWFLISFLFANGYYNAILEINFGVIASIALFQYCLICTIVSALFYILGKENK